MKVPLEWLKEYVTIRRSPDTLAKRLTLAGHEVVGIRQSDDGPIFDLEITPNRADCLSIIGIAREVAAITDQRLKPKNVQGSGFRVGGKTKKPRTPNPEPRTNLTIRIEDPKGCPRYIGRLIDGVTIGPSPAWMQQRLAACGIRAINNIVDITNYVLLEYGQPLHAFDFGRLDGGAIVVRRARAKEPITTLDGLQRLLAPEMLVIADAARAVAVAGVMGGQGSEVLPQTTRVLLESALFDPISVRRTGRALGLASESSYRFERGVDPAGVEAASLRAAGLIRTLAGGREVAARDAGRAPSTRTVVQLDPQRMSRWLGLRVDPGAMRTKLARLSCRVSSSEGASAWRVEPPSFRKDLVREVDLYEELARLIGYDQIAGTIPAGPIAAPDAAGSTSYRRTETLRDLCAGLGLEEIVTWSLLSEAELGRCGVPATQAIRLSNPLSQDHSILRPSLLSGMLQTVRRNLTQGAAGVRAFEIGRVVNRDPSGTGAPVETTRLGMVISGLWSGDWHRKEPSDFFRLKGLIETAVERGCGARVHMATTPQPWAQPGESVELQLEERPLGAAGRVSQAILHALDLEEDVWVAELSVEALFAAKRAAILGRAPSTFPPVKRDLSFLVDRQTPFESLHASIQESGAPLAHRVELIDRYAGLQVPKDKVSLTYSIEYRDPARTLTAEEIDMLHRRMGQTLTERFGATLR